MTRAQNGKTHDLQQEMSVDAHQDQTQQHTDNTRDSARKQDTGTSHQRRTEKHAERR